jgi:hypothetical protein
MVMTRQQKARRMLAQQNTREDEPLEKLAKRFVVMNISNLSRLIMVFSSAITP